MPTLIRRTSHYLRFHLGALAILCLAVLTPLHSQESDQDYVLRVAPEQCIAFSAWSGLQPPSPNTTNQAELLLAEPEIQEFAEKISQQIASLAIMAMRNEPQAKQQAVKMLAPQFIKLLFTKPGAFFVESVGFGQEGLDISAGLTFDFGEGASNLVDSIVAIARMEGLPVESVDLEGVQVYTLEIPDAPLTSPVYFASANNRILISLGTQGTARLIDTAKQEDSSTKPSWLAEAQEKLPVERRTSLGYINISQIFELAIQFGGEDAQQAAQIAEVLGLRSLTNLATSTGYDAKGVVDHIRLSWAGEASGLLSLMGEQPLDQETLKLLPADSLFAASVSLDVNQMLDKVIAMLEKIDPNEAENAYEALQEFKEETGFDLRTQFLQHLGPSWTIFNGAGDGLFAGMIMVIDVKDPDALSDSLLEVAGTLRGLARRSDIPILRRTRVGNSNVFTLSIPDTPMPIHPAFAVHGNHLFVSLFPQTLRPYFEPSELDQKLNIASLGLPQDSTSFSYVDVARQYEILYSYAAVLFGMLETVADEADFGPDGEALASMLSQVTLPSCRSIHRHVLPSVSFTRRESTAWHVTTTRTVPSVDITLTAPIAVGLLLPAVQAARSAARRMQSSNNLKQLQLSLLNYESAFRAFPAAYSVDNEGNPLLSWRVHILPFLEQNELYEEFHLDEPWDSEHNIQLLDRMPAFFRSPESQAPQGMTVYRANGGENGVITITDRQLAAKKFPTGVRIGSITDGTSNTISIVEASDDLAIEWTKPEEFEATEDNFDLLFGLHAGGTNSVFVDGSVHFLSEFIDVDVLSLLFNRQDGRPVNF